MYIYILISSASSTSVRNRFSYYTVSRGYKLTLLCILNRFGRQPHAMPRSFFTDEGKVTQLVFLAVGQLVARPVVRQVSRVALRVALPVAVASLVARLVASPAAQPEWVALAVA